MGMLMGPLETIPGRGGSCANKSGRICTHGTHVVIYSTNTKEQIKRNSRREREYLYSVNRIYKQIYGASCYYDGTNRKIILV